jgi:hypothetical protein
MLPGEGEVLTWARASDARAERAETAQNPAWRRPLHGRLAAAGPVVVGDVGTEPRWAEVAPALVAAELRAALSVPVELAGGPIGTLEVYGAGPRDWNDSEAAALQAYAGVVASLLRGAAAARVKGGAGRAAAVGAGPSCGDQAGQGGADGAGGAVAGGGVCAAARRGPLGRAHGGGGGRHRAGRWQPAPPPAARPTSHDDCHRTPTGALRAPYGRAWDLRRGVAYGLYQAITSRDGPLLTRRYRRFVPDVPTAQEACLLGQRLGLRA